MLSEGVNKSVKPRWSDHRGFFLAERPAKSHIPRVTCALVIWPVALSFTEESGRCQRDVLNPIRSPDPLEAELGRPG